MNTLDVGKNLKALRLSNGLSQMDLASLLGIAQGTLSKLEAGDLELSYSQAIAICNHFKIQFEQLSFPYLDNERQLSAERISEVFKGNLKVPKELSRGMEFTMRFVTPLIEFEKMLVGNEAFLLNLKQAGYNESYFRFYDDILNTTILEKLAPKAILKIKQLETLKTFKVLMGEKQRASFFHGRVYSSYEVKSDMLAISKKFFKNIPLHYCNLLSVDDFQAQGSHSIKFSLGNANFDNKVILACFEFHLKSLLTSCILSNEKLEIQKKRKKSTWDYQVTIPAIT